MCYRSYKEDRDNYTTRWQVWPSIWGIRVWSRIWVGDQIWVGDLIWAVRWSYLGRCLHFGEDGLHFAQHQRLPIQGVGVFATGLQCFIETFVHPIRIHLGISQLSQGMNQVHGEMGFGDVVAYSRKNSQKSFQRIRARLQNVATTTKTENQCIKHKIT